MAFISSGYNPQKPMEGRITDIGPHKYDSMFPPVIAKNFGKWQYHEILEPGLLMHVAESGDKAYTVRCAGSRTMSITAIREVCDIADKYTGGFVRWTTRNNPASSLAAPTSSPWAAPVPVSATLCIPRAGCTATPPLPTPPVL